VGYSNMVMSMDMGKGNGKLCQYYNWFRRWKSFHSSFEGYLMIAEMFQSLLLI